MVKTFKEILEEITVATSTGTRTVKSFSRSDFDRLITAYLNTNEYESEIAKTKDGELVVEKIQPVKAFRAMISDIVKHCGVDAQEATNIVDKYIFKESQGRTLYDICSDVIYEYCKVGKKFDLPTRKDYKGGFVIEKVDKAITEYKAPKTGESGKVEKDEHYRLKAKSKVPKWLKKKINS